MNKLRIKTLYFFGSSFYTIEKNIDGHWIKVLDLADGNIKLARKLKKFLVFQPI